MSRLHHLGTPHRYRRDARGARPDRDPFLALRQVQDEYDGQSRKSIVQNFRAKPDTKMRGTPRRGKLARPGRDDRRPPGSSLGPRARHVRPPPNLVGNEHQPHPSNAGIDDWGGGVSPLTPDHVNPERPWPQLDVLAGLTATAGFHAQKSA